MNKKLWLIALVVPVIAISLYLLPLNTVSYKTPVLEEKQLPVISHRQETWIRVLEWCESQGVITAVNPKDLDDTPSYYSFQFKPSTFRYFGELYEVIPKGLSEKQLMEEIKKYELQYAILVNMVANRDKIEWKRQFPACVKKYGLPPKADIVPTTP